MNSNIDSNLENILYEYFRTMPGLNYGHIYSELEIKWIRIEFQKMKSMRVSRNEKYESFLETQYRKHLNIPLEKGIIPRETSLTKNRIKTPSNNNIFKILC